MFNRLATARIKAAEDAMAAGRLEEAYDVATLPDVADSRAARPLREKLVTAFLTRGQERLLSRQFTEAIADFDKAARCGAAADVVKEWRTRAVDAQRDDANAQVKKASALREAHQRLAVGSLAGAADAVAKSPVQDRDAAAMNDEIERQRSRAETALTAARTAFDAGHLATAVQQLLAARTAHAKLEGIIELEARIVARIVDQGRASFAEGRLDRAEKELGVLSDLGRHSTQRSELEEAVRIAKEAASAMSDGRYSKACVLMGRLGQMEIKASWVESVRKQLDAIDDQRRVLLEGPLGLLLGRKTPTELDAASLVGQETMAKPANIKVPPVIAAVAKSPAANGLFSRHMMLRIDGVGSFLLLRGDRIGIGRSGPDATADLQLLSDLSERQAEVVRAGEDYFLVSMSGVELAGRPVEHALLQDGDRIRLGHRVKLKFLRPSLKSSAAVLELGDGVRTTSDCRRVILWSGPLLLGGTRECHVPIRGAAAGVILMERGGVVSVRSMVSGGQPVTLSMGVPVEFNGMRLSIQEAARGSGLGRVIG